MTAIDTLAANELTANQLAGQADEFTRAPARIRVALAASTTGAQAYLSIGGETVLDFVAVSQINRFPQIPEDVVGEWLSTGGDRIILRYRESAGGTPTVYGVVDVIY